MILKSSFHEYYAIAELLNCLTFHHNLNNYEGCCQSITSLSSKNVCSKTLITQCMLLKCQNVRLFLVSYTITTMAVFSLHSLPGKKKHCLSNSWRY